MSSEDFPESILKWDNISWDNEIEFEKRVNDVNKRLGLDGDERFIPHCPATFFCGNVLEAKYIIVGLNPGYKKNETEKEMEWRNNLRIII